MSKTPEQRLTESFLDELEECCFDEAMGGFDRDKSRTVMLAYVAAVRAQRAEGGTMVGQSKMLTEAPATTMSVKDRHLYVMDKNGLWFHFEPKDSPSMNSPRSTEEKPNG